jgi:hypothetical protein
MRLACWRRVFGEVTVGCCACGRRRVGEGVESGGGIAADMVVVVMSWMEIQKRFVVYINSDGSKLAAAAALPQRATHSATNDQGSTL